MKTIKFALALSAVFLFAQNSSAQCGMTMSHQMTDTPDRAKTNSDSLRSIYTCPMHPEVTSDKPGFCPKCGMKLVKKNAGENRNEKMNRDKMMMGKGMMTMMFVAMGIMMVAMIVVVGSHWR